MSANRIEELLANMPLTSTSTSTSTLEKKTDTLVRVTEGWVVYFDKDNIIKFVTDIEASKKFSIEKEKKELMKLAKKGPRNLRTELLVAPIEI
jgi:hypothetical protein